MFIYIFVYVTNMTNVCIGYFIVVQATEMMDSSKHNSSDIQIIILDINDNYPAFDRQEYNISVNETTPLRSSILTVTAIDLDEVCLL